MMVIADKSDLRMIVVEHVFPRTPAAEAGLREGDVIETLNGKETKSMTVDAFRAALRAPGRRLTLAVRRSDAQMTVSLTTRHELEATNPRLSTASAATSNVTVRPYI